MDALLSEVEAATLLSVRPLLLRRWRTEGTGPPYIKLRRGIRYDRADILDFIAAKKIEPGNQKGGGIT